ncbi:MAG: sigma-70 family RNA polymerase sigma factor [Gemmataceae bacterium]|nr:sigma-70 family RNA polymerase sigma factor [Gemmataceae bacterium]
MSESEDALVGRARGGDRSAFEELVRRTSRLVFARLYLDVGRTDRTEDLVQETFLRAFKAVRYLDSAGEFRPWLLAIAQNVLIDDARRAARLKRTPPAPPAHLTDVPSAELPPDEQASLSELRERVRWVLRALPDEYRLPLTLRYIAGADHETIERQLGLTNGALRGLLHRGLKLLRERLPADLAAEFGAAALNRGNQ